MLNGVLHTQLLLALDFLRGPSSEVVVVSGGDGPEAEVASRIFRPFLPRKVVLHLHAGAKGLKELAPYAAELPASEDAAATLFVCREFTCSAPTTSIDEALAAIGGG